MRVPLEGTIRPLRMFLCHTRLRESLRSQTNWECILCRSESMKSWTSSICWSSLLRYQVKRRARIFIALDMLYHQDFKQAIIAAYERMINRSLTNANLTEHGFWTDWKIPPKFGFESGARRFLVRKQVCQLHHGGALAAGPSGSFLGHGGSSCRTANVSRRTRCQAMYIMF